MPARKSTKLARVEVLAPATVQPSGPPTPAAALEALSRLVKQQVAQVLAERDQAVLEPWFRSRAVAHEIQRLQSVPERKKWGAYFERFGCVRCGKKSADHSGNGFCNACRSMVHQRLERVLADLGSTYEANSREHAEALLSEKRNLVEAERVPLSGLKRARRTRR